MSLLTKLERLVSEMTLIHELRADEGDTVAILCDNPDFGSPSNAVECNGAWTGYGDRRFEGDSLLAALRMAAEAKRADAGSPPNPTPEVQAMKPEGKETR